MKPSELLNQAADALEVLRFRYREGDEASTSGRNLPSSYSQELFLAFIYAEWVGITLVRNDACDRPSDFDLVAKLREAAILAASEGN